MRREGDLMPRPADGWTLIGSILSRTLATPLPRWVRPATAAQVGAALAMLRADALAAIGSASTRDAPAALSMGRTPYMAARAHGGWLSTDAPPGATLAEVFAAQDAHGTGRPRST